MGNPTIKPGMSDETGRLIASSINALADAIQAENGAEATQNGSEAPVSGTANLGTTVKPRMSDEAGLSIAGNIDKLTAAVQKYGKTTWDEVAHNVKTGKAPQIYGIGDELICNYRHYESNDVDFTDHEFPWVVAGFRNVEWEDGTIHPGMILQAKHCTIESVDFDAAEKVYCDPNTEMVAEEGIYYFGESSYESEYGGFEYDYEALGLSAGDEIPYGEYENICKNEINDDSLMQEGYGNYKMSAQRQWLNSSGGRGEWWQPTHIGDVAPYQANMIRGFLNGLDSEFIAVVNPIKIQAARDTVTDGGGIDVMYDKFFLPSVEEMYGVPRLADVEGEYFEYWKEKTLLDAPSNNKNDGRIITRLDNDIAQYCRLRSAGGTSANVVTTVGGVAGNAARLGWCCAPACVIS